MDKVLVQCIKISTKKSNPIYTETTHSDPIPFLTGNIFLSQPDPQFYTNYETYGNLLNHRGDLSLISSYLEHSVEPNPYMHKPRYSCAFDVYFTEDPSEVHDTTHLTKMSKKSRKIHKETATTVFTGLLINYPLNLAGLYICINLLGMSDAFTIGTTITAYMTLVAYTRVYLIRRHFYQKDQKDSENTVK